jgi:DNA-binding PadR family transcriptional regulator
MKVPLYVLGFLSRYGSQHGYRLKQYLEHISDFAHIKLPTIYYHLGKLEKEGLISASQEKEGNRPEKRVYTITNDGKQVLREMLENALASSYRGEFLVDSVLYFNDLVETQHVIDVLTHQIRRTEKILQEIERHKEESLQQQPGRFHVFARAIFRHHEYHTQAELKWLRETVSELRQHFEETGKKTPEQ